jgi:hypothetical protein
MAKILILSPPRNGSSVLANLVESSGYKNYTSDNSTLLNPSEFNKAGYFEDTLITLLNDQLIRMVYGDEYSFLYTPTLEQFKNINLNYSSNFFHDIESPFIPENYQNKIEHYTGKDWDVWGLTRMFPGEKWYKCYSKYGVDTKENIIKTLIE